MKTAETTVNMLESSPGEYLTQAILKEGEERIFATKVFLAKDSVPEDWRSASQDEKDDYISPYQHEMA